MSNRLKIFIVTFFLVLLFSGCSDSIENGLKNVQSDETILLAEGEEAIIYKGDSLSSSNSETVIKIRHNPNEEYKKVTVISGDLTLVRGEYEVE